MLRKLALATMLFGQILLFAAVAGNTKVRDGDPIPPCFPCYSATAVLR